MGGRERRGEGLEMRGLCQEERMRLGRRVLETDGRLLRKATT